MSVRRSASGARLRLSRRRDDNTKASTGCSPDGTAGATERQTLLKEVEESRRLLQQVRREQRNFKKSVVAWLASAATLILAGAVVAVVQRL